VERIFCQKQLSAFVCGYSDAKILKYVKNFLSYGQICSVAPFNLAQTV